MRSTLFLLGALLGSIALPQGQARAPDTAPPPPPPPPPPVYPAVAARPNAAPESYVYDQKPISARSYLIAPDQAQTIIKRFKDDYKALGNPRFLIFVNRDLVDQN